MTYLVRNGTAFAVCLLFSFIFSTSSASLQCLDLFELRGKIVANDDEAMDLLGQAEVRLQELITSGRIAELEEVFRIQSDIESVLAVLGSGRLMQSEIHSIFSRIEHLERESTYPQKGMAKTATNEVVVEVWTFDKMIEPSQIKPDQVYLFEWRGQSKNIKVNFSKRVIEDIFEKAEHHVGAMDAARKLLRTITKGFVGSAESNGIKRFNADKSVFEVSFIGATGTWRMGAYLHDGVLYVTHGVSSGSHGGSNYGTAFINTVNGVRRQSGH